MNILSRIKRFKHVLCDWLIKVGLHENVSLSGSTIQRLKIFVSCNMKKNKTLIFRVVFVASYVKKHTAPRRNFLGICNATMFYSIRM